MFRHVTNIILILLVSYTMSFAHEGGLGKYVIKAYRLDNVPPPKIDGKLDDEAWKKATPVRGFIQKEPDRGKPATDDTEAYVVYDRHNLYLGFRCYDKEPEKILNYIARRGESYLSDTIKVILDPYHDHRTGYSFEISPGGVKADSYRYDDSKRDWSWEGIWWGEGHIDEAVHEVTAERSEQGWTAEFKIPFSNFRFKNERNQVWGIDFERIIRRKLEISYWKPMLKEGKEIVMSDLGHLVGLRDIAQRKHLEVYPYTLGGASKNRDEAIGKKVETGLDIQYNLKNTLKAHLAVNPDFAQVEADRLRINLSRFPSRFAEKRPFFVEGNSVFSTPYELFYSRRIGQRGDILWGAKMTGKVGDYTLGFISSQTGSWDYFGLRERDENKEEALYSILRLKKDVFSRSNVGIIWADKEMDESYSRVGGLDANLGFLKSYRLSSQIAQSWDSNSAGRGGAYKLSFSQNSDRWNGNVSLERMDTNFDANQTGFIYKEAHRGWQKGSFIAQYTPRVGWKGLHKVYIRYSSRLLQHLYTDEYFQNWQERHPDLRLNPKFRRDLIEWNYGIFCGLEFQESFLGRAAFTYGRSREVELTDIFPADSYSLYISTDWTRRIEGKLILFARDYYNFSQQYVGTQKELRASGTMKLRRNLKFNLDSNYVQSYNPQKAVDGRFLTGSLRTTYLFTRDVFFRIFVQTGLSRTYYDAISTNKSYLVSTLLGWEYSPKSHFFIAYNEDWRTSEGKLRLDDRVIVMKVSYLWNL